MSTAGFLPPLQGPAHPRSPKAMAHHRNPVPKKAGTDSLWGCMAQPEGISEGVWENRKRATGKWTGVYKQLSQFSSPLPALPSALGHHQGGWCLRHRERKPQLTLLVYCCWASTLPVPKFSFCPPHPTSSHCRQSSTAESQLYLLKRENSVESCKREPLRTMRKKKWANPSHYRDGGERAECAFARSGCLLLN